MSSVETSLADAFASFVPIDRRFALARGESIPERIAGAALACDLSDFTPLVVELGAIYGDKRAAEEITEALNGVFMPLIDIAHEHGGSVIGFAGDAMTCWFDDDDGVRALGAAIGMRNAVGRADEFQVVDRRRKISIKIAVAAGDARRYVVGDPAIQRMDTLAGPLIDRLDEILQLCAPGEVVAGPEVAAAAGDDLRIGGERETAGVRYVVCDGMADRGTRPWPPLPPVQTARYRSWVLPSIADRLEAGGAALLSEVRPVVAVFVQLQDVLGDSDFDDGVALDEYVGFVQRTVAELEGDLIGLTIGDKGNSLYIVFGATTAHEDDEHRAVRAAILLRSPPPEIELGRNASFGISAGEMRVGTYGNAMRRTFDVQGMEVNVANRLMTRAAPGEILISERVAKRVARSTETEPLGELSLKGIDLTLRAYRVLRERNRLLDALPDAEQSPMVGRAQELADLTLALDRVADGGFEMALIEGPPGIGKSRLLAELRSMAALRGMTTWYGAIEEIDSRRPCYIWSRIGRHAFDIDLEDRGDATRDKIACHLPPGEDGQELMPLLNTLFSMQLPETPATERLMGRLRATALAKVLLTALDHARGGQPLLLVLEDAHWMDALSLSVIAAARKVLGATLIVVSSRNLPRGAEMLSIVERLGATHMRLDALDESSIRNMIASRFGVQDLPDELAHYIHDKSAGQPFFAEQLASALRDAGRIQVEDGQCVVSADRSLKDLEFPDTLQGIITSRLDKLPQSQQLALKVSSVVGQRFDYDTVEQIYPSRGAVEWLKTDLEALTRQDITTEVESQPTPVYMFRHALFRDVVYQRLLTSQRRDLHRAVAEFYEQKFADDPSPYYPVLAHHWEAVTRGGKPDTGARDKAVAYMRKAGGQAQRSGLLKDAVGFGLDAAALLDVVLPTDPAAIANRISTAEAAIAQKMGEQDVQALLELEPMSSPDMGKAVEILLEIMPAMYMAGMRDLFTLAAFLNLELTLEYGNAPATPVAHSMYAIQRRTQFDDIEGAYAFSNLALSLDKREGGNYSTICSYIHTRFIDLWRNPIRNSISLNLESAKPAVDAGLTLYGCWHASLAIQHSSAAGVKLDELAASARELRDFVGRRVESSRFHCILDLQYAKALAGNTQSRFSLTDPEHDEQKDLARILDTDLDNQMLYYHVTRLKLHTLYYDYERAIELADEAFAILEASAGQVGEIELRFYFAVSAFGLCLFGSADGARLRGRAKQQLDIISGWREHCEANFGHLADFLKGCLCSLDGRDDEAVRHFETAASQAALNEFTQHEALSHECLGLHLFRFGQPDEATARLETAIDAYERWGAHRKAAHVREQIARCSKGGKRALH